jgi:HlyD family secretion protein
MIRRAPKHAGMIGRAPSATAPERAGNTVHVDIPAPVTPAAQIPPQTPETQDAPGAFRAAAATPPAWPRRRRLGLLLIAAAAVSSLLCVVVVLVVHALFPAAPPAQLPVSGRLEGYQSDLGAKVGGRVVWVAVREGALVRKGQVLVRLDDAQARAQVAATAAAVLAAEFRAHQAEATLGVLASQIDETTLDRAEATADTNGRVAQARASFAAAQAQVAQAAALVGQAQATRAFASVDRARYESLSRTGDVSLQSAEQADTAYRTAASAVVEYRAALAAARRNAGAAAAALDVAQSTSYNATIAAAQGATLERRERETQAQIAAAGADAGQARALQRGALAALADLTVRAASDGTVIARAVEPGDVVAAGRILLSVLDLDHVYLRGYVPEGDIGRVRLGQTAHVVLDSDTKRDLAARVGEIDSQASFTPENVYFKADRVQEVFGVRLDLRDPRGFAKPGMPADAVIDVGRP